MSQAYRYQCISPERRSNGWSRSAPAPGCAAMATLVSHVGVCCIGINLDTAAVTKPALLMQCLQESLDEIVALGVTTEGA